MKFRSSAALAVAVLAALAQLPAARAAGGPWSQRMKKLQATLEQVLADASTEERFEAKANRARIERNARELAELASGLNDPKAGAPDRDPSLKIVAGLFSEEAQYAYETLKAGHRPYARSVLRSMTAYCIACHSRNDSGPQFQGLKSDPAKLGLKDGVEKASFLAATRQFDQALAELENVVAHRSAHLEQPLEWEDAVRLSIGIAVRVKKDPDSAIRIVERVRAEQKAPLFIREEADQWLKSLKEWKEELARKPESAEGMYAEALRLVAKAKVLQEYPLDHSADIVYLRATATLHDLMNAAPDGPHAAQALYLLGVSYEVLQEISLWDMHEYYYLACIRKAPRTETSKACFRQYEQSVYAGYSGSGGTFIPWSVRNRLKELEQLAIPESEPKSKLQ